MIGYTDAFIVIGLDGEQHEINKCRLDGNSIFTKDDVNKIQSGSKIIRVHEDGCEDHYFVKSVGKKNLNGSIEISVTRI